MVNTNIAAVTMSEQDLSENMNLDQAERLATAAGDTVLGSYSPLVRAKLDQGRIFIGKLALQGGVDRFLVSDAGYVLILGWLADEGCELPQCTVISGDRTVELSPDLVLRHARPDIEAHVRQGAYDFGFVVFGKAPPRCFETRPLTLQFSTPTSACEMAVAPEVISNKRLLDTMLIAVADIRAHGGREVGLHAFLSGAAGRDAQDLFGIHIACALVAHHVERFRPRPVARSFVTVLFGTAEPILLKPILFRQHGIDFGEWIYVCNSPEDATAVLRLSRMMSDLYDFTITAIIMADNVGFGAANNVAIGHAASDAIYVVNPDVYPMREQADVLRQTLEAGDLRDRLTGGLLFYDDGNLMHSGMYVEKDLFFRGQALNRPVGPAAAVGLLRVEHFDKGVPFVPAQWSGPVAVPAITGAAMAFDRRYFERIGGFSTRYIYGHYEDADLSLRWARENGPVMVDPRLRLIHLEGQGSRARGEQYRSAAIVNRYFFTQRHGADIEARPGASTGRHAPVPT